MVRKDIAEFMSKSIPPMFSSRSFIVSSLTYRSLIHFKLIFVYDVKERSNFIFFLCVCHVFPTPFAEESVFPTLCSLAYIVRD